MQTIKTQDARRWFTIATDPFHDFDIPLAGYPDSYAGETVVQLVKKKVTITAPTGLPVGQTWDCHVNTMPTLVNHKMGWTATNQAANDVRSGPNNPSASTVGTVTVTTVPTGDLTYPQWMMDDWADPAKIALRSVTGHSPSEGDNGRSMSRLIGGGFEVHNDTSPMFRSGNVTVYSHPQNKTTSQKLAGDADGDFTAAVDTYRCPPSRADYAAKLHDARSFTAEQGALVPFRMNVEEDNSFRPITTHLQEYKVSDDTLLGDKSASYISMWDDSVPATCKTCMIGGVYDPAGAGTFGSGTGGIRDAHIETSGAYFTGLSPETVLTLSLRFYVEVAPTMNNTSLLSMASPSATPDPKALWCYAHCMMKLPPGVPVDMNEKGDWWRAVKKAAATMLPIVGDVAGLVTGQPELAVLGNAAGSLVAATTKKKHPGKQKGSGGANNDLRSKPVHAVVRRK